MLSFFSENDFSSSYVPFEKRASIPLVLGNRNRIVRYCAHNAEFRGFCSLWLIHCRIAIFQIDLQELFFCSYWSLLMEMKAQQVRNLGLSIMEYTSTSTKIMGCKVLTFKCRKHWMFIKVWTFISEHRWYVLNIKVELWHL